MKFTIDPISSEDAKYIYLTNIEHSYNISAEGIGYNTTKKNIINQIRDLANEEGYRYYYVLSQGVVGRSLLNPKVSMLFKIKFFYTEEEYIVFQKSYNPFGL